MNPPNIPHSIEAEEYLLSCCLLDGADVVSRCIEAGIRPGSFYLSAHRVIYQCAIDLYNRQSPIELSVLAEELRTGNQLDSVGGYAFLTQVSSRIPTTAQAGYFIEKVKQLDHLREVIKAAMGVIEAAKQPDAKPGELIAHLRGGLERITDPTAGLGRCVSAAELCANPPPVPPEIIQGVLYGRGTMMLSGPSKSRKTYTFLDLAVSVATGCDWLGFTTSKAPVLYLNFELSEHSFQRRLAAICLAKGLQPPPDLRSINLRGHTATIGTLAADLPRLISKHEVGLVVLDPWYKVSAQSGVEENSNDGQALILSEAERIVTSSGAALVVGHHFSKGNAAAKNSIDRAAGAGAMARWGDVMASLSEHEESDAMTLEFHLRDFAPVAALALRWHQPLWSRDDRLDPSKLKRPGRSDEHPSSELLAKLKDGMINAEWQDAVGWSDSTYRRKREELVKREKVVCVSGTYRHA